MDRPTKVPVMRKAKISGDTISKQSAPSFKNIKLQAMASMPFKIEYPINCLLLRFMLFQHQAEIIPIRMGMITNSENMSSPGSFCPKLACKPITVMANRLAASRPIVIFDGIDSLMFAWLLSLGLFR